LAWFVRLLGLAARDERRADFYSFEPAFLGRVATRIVNEVRGVNRIVYGCTSKPPGTIEWEWAAWTSLGGRSRPRSR
jgi:GMP synthase (glutamine-hydrolysing)